MTHMSRDSAWLQAMATKEANSIVSAGGLASRLPKILRKLGGQSTMVWLVFFQGLTVEQAGAQLGLTPLSARRRLFKECAEVARSLRSS